MCTDPGVQICSQCCHRNEQHQFCCTQALTMCSDHIHALHVKLLTLCRVLKWGLWLLCPCLAVLNADKLQWNAYRLWSVAARRSAQEPIQAVTLHALPYFSINGWPAKALWGSCGKNPWVVGVITLMSHLWRLPLHHKGHQSKAVIKGLGCHSCGICKASYCRHSTKDNLDLPYWWCPDQLNQPRQNAIITFETLWPATCDKT